MITARMTDAFIELQRAVLRYPVGPFVKGSIKSNFLGAFRRKDGARDSYTALNGVDLTIRSGEKVGLIGRNGAGKSTLLRAIAGIYPLAEGRIVTRGKIQALFDIALGFEGDSTGHENIAYRGLAMGCDPKEIAARTDEIVAFAAIGDFIDMPMRTYSMGMHVRLAFAISTYLEGDILLIDEVFGAGDADFRLKAIRRMETIVEKAKIVVFVSHELATVERLCTRVLWVQDGEIKADGPPRQVISQYLLQVTQSAA